MQSHIALQIYIVDEIFLHFDEIQGLVKKDCNQNAGKEGGVNGGKVHIF